MTRHVRAAFVALSLRSDDEVAATCLELARLGAARGCREFLCRPREKGFPYALARKARAAHLVVLHRLLNSAEPLPEELLKRDATAVVRFLALGVQAGFHDVEDGQVLTLPPKDQALHHLALGARLRALACAAAAGSRRARATPSRPRSAPCSGADAAADDDDGGGGADDDDDDMLAEEDPRISDALLEPHRGARALVARFLLGTSLLGDVLALVRRAPSADVAALDALAGASARVAGAASRAGRGRGAAYRRRRPRGVPAGGAPGRGGGVVRRRRDHAAAAPRNRRRCRASSSAWPTPAPCASVPRGGLAPRSRASPRRRPARGGAGTWRARSAASRRRAPSRRSSATRSCTSGPGRRWPPPTRPPRRAATSTPAASCGCP